MSSVRRAPLSRLTQHPHVSSRIILLTGQTNASLVAFKISAGQFSDLNLPPVLTCSYCRTQQFSTMMALYSHFHTCPNSPYRGGSSIPPDLDLTWSRPTSRQPSPSPSTISRNSTHPPSPSGHHPVYETRSSSNPRFSDSLTSGQAVYPDEYSEASSSARVFVNRDTGIDSTGPRHDDLTPRARDYPPFFHDPQGRSRQRWQATSDVPAHAGYSHVDPSSLLLAGMAASSSSAFVRSDSSSSGASPPLAMSYQVQGTDMHRDDPRNFRFVAQESMESGGSRRSPMASSQNDNETGGTSQHATATASSRHNFSPSHESNAMILESTALTALQEDEGTTSKLILSSLLRGAIA